MCVYVCVRLLCSTVNRCRVVQSSTVNCIAVQCSSVQCTAEKSVKSAVIVFLVKCVAYRFSCSVLSAVCSAVCSPIVTRQG